MFVGRWFVYLFMSFNISGLVSESIYVNSQHVKTEIFADSIFFQQQFMLLLVATFDRRIVQEHFALTATFILALFVSHPACGLFISTTYTHWHTHILVPYLKA